MATTTRTGDAAVSRTGEGLWVDDAAGRSRLAAGADGGLSVSRSDQPTTSGRLTAPETRLMLHRHGLGPLADDIRAALQVYIKNFAM